MSEVVERLVIRGSGYFSLELVIAVLGLSQAFSNYLDIEGIVEHFPFLLPQLFLRPVYY